MRATLSLPLSLWIFRRSYRFLTMPKLRTHSNGPEVGPIRTDRREAESCWLQNAAHCSRQESIDRF